MGSNPTPSATEYNKNNMLVYFIARFQPYSPPSHWDCLATRDSKLQRVAQNLNALVQGQRAYARHAKDTQLVQYATEIKVRAERRAGELLRDGKRALAQDNLLRGPKSNGATSGPTLEDIGITRDQSSRWQQVARGGIESVSGAIAGFDCTNAGRRSEQGC